MDINPRLSLAKESTTKTGGLSNSAAKSSSHVEVRYSYRFCDKHVADIIIIKADQFPADGIDVNQLRAKFGSNGEITWICDTANPNTIREYIRNKTVHILPNSMKVMTGEGDAS